MPHTEKEFELEGHTLPTLDLLVEAQRILDLARAQGQFIRLEGVEVKHLTDLEQVRELCHKEHLRVEAPPPKPPALTKEQELLVHRALRWRAALVRRADRAFADERYTRLRYHRLFELHGILDRVYEELFLLHALAKMDARRLAAFRVDDGFIQQGEDLLYELRGLPVPERKPAEDGEPRKRGGRLGGFAEPVADPDEAPSLPAVVDNAHVLSVLKGRLWVQMKNLSNIGQIALTLHAKEVDKTEPTRRDFILRLKPTEDDETLVALGKYRADPAPDAKQPGRPPAKPAASRPLEPKPAVVAAPPPPAPASPAVPGPSPAAPGGDAFKKPPPRAVGLVRPSPTHGRTEPSK
jgi:hypothetical protein